MTRVLQFMPPLYVLDRVVAFLLLKAGKSDAEQSWMTGYVIIVTLAGPDHGHRGQPRTAIASQVTRGTVDESVPLEHLVCQEHQDDNAC